MGEIMIGNYKFLGNNKRRGSFISNNKGQFAILICIGFIALYAFSPINLQSAMADIPGMNIYETPGKPHKTNLTEIQYCTECHTDEMPDVWLTVTVDSQTTGDITYFVTGSDIYDGEEGWAVFDSLENNKLNGLNSGTFTLPKDGYNYRVFWVDNGTGGTGEGGGGSAYEDITTPNDPPSNPTITGEKNGQNGQSYTYTFVSTDPQDQDIFYMIEWGDGQTLDWFGPNPSGQEVTKSHSWADQGTYTIRAKARDIYGKESGWGTLEVTMPKSKQANFNLNIFYWLFERFPNAFPILKYILVVTGFMDGFIRHGTGKLVMQLTDAPGLNITEAIVNISKVRVHYAGWDQNDTNGTWVNVSNVTQTFDLIQLQNATDVLGEINLTAGWYTQIRLTVDKALVTIDGIQYDLKIPSKNVKLITPFLVQDNETLTLTLDFDVQKSVHKTGSDKYIMKPTIKVIQE
jgi:hypothetical protein